MTKSVTDHGMFSSMQQRINHKDFQNCLFAYFLSQVEPKKTLVDLLYGKRDIGIKWIYRIKKDKRVASIEAIRLFLAYASFKDFVVYQMDVKSAFLYGKIEEEVYVCQPPGFEDPEFPDRVYKVEKALYGLHQAPRAWYKTLSTYLLDNGFQRGQIDKNLFIKRVKGQPKLGLWYPKDSPFYLEAYTDSDYAGASLDMKSTTGVAVIDDWNGLEMIRMKLGLKLVTQKVNAAGHYLVLLGENKFESIAKDKIVNNERQIRAKVNGKTIVISESSVRRDLQFNDEDGTVTPLFATMLIQPQADVAEGSGQPTEPQHIPTIASPSNIEPIPIIASSSQPQKTHKCRKTKRPTKTSQSSGPTTLVADENVHEERGDSMERAATTAASLDAEQDSGDRPAQTRFERLSKQSNDPPLLGVNTPRKYQDCLGFGEIRKEEKGKNSITQEEGRNIAESNQDEVISFVQEDAETQGRYGYDFEVNTASAPFTTAGVSVSLAEPSTPPTTTTVIEDEDLIIAQILIKMRKPSEAGTRRAVPPSQHDLKDKGKSKMIKPEKPSKKKDQIKFDEEVAKRLAEELEVELEEEERVTIQREEEANLISWDNTQSIIEADYELA
ncbi:putative ribonuclease H-like domain-containing protein [Tanacetum coccineum]